jgi:hypothetical protein
MSTGVGCFPPKSSRRYESCTPAGTEGMGNFFAELERRHIYRVAAAYAVVAYDGVGACSDRQQFGPDLEAGCCVAARLQSSVKKAVAKDDPNGPF